VPKEHIYKILEKADIGLLPLQNSPVFKWGISPNKLYDYSISKLPVMLFCDLNDTFLETHNAGKVFKQNFKDEFVNYISNVGTKELKSMGKSGETFVREEHEWYKLAKKLEQVMLKDLN